MVTMMHSSGSRQSSQHSKPPTASVTVPVQFLGLYFGSHGMHLPFALAERTVNNGGGAVPPILTATH